MKTRKSQNPPSSQQIIKDKMQGMIYWYVLNAMINGKTEMGDFWSAYGVDLIEPDFNEIILSEEYMESLQIPENEQKEVGTLLGIGTLITEVIQKFKELPELSKTIEIIYINQKTLTEVHREKYMFDERFFTRGMEWALEYWSGKRSPTSVGEANNWKCNFCGYYTLCPAIHKKWKQGD
jgi:exonuclease V